MRNFLFGLTLLVSLSFVTYAQTNPLLFPERANSRINASVEIARQIKQMGHNRIAVVYMETSDLCALFSASLVSSLKTLGVEAYYIKGGDGLEERLKNLMPLHVYMAYFGERPHEEVQTQFNQDLKRVLKYEKNPNLILQPALLAIGFVNGLLAEEELSTVLQDLPMLSFLFEGGKAKPVNVVIKDIEVRVVPKEVGKDQRGSTKQRKK
ncbi:MAG: hypothetical protein NZ851_05090 [Aquificaceae bacterium]|nr:hypothetical protein [Aquificaceae bacterium]